MDIATLALRLFRIQAQILKAINGSSLYGHERLMVILNTGVKLADWLEHDAGGMSSFDDLEQARRCLRDSTQMTSNFLEGIRQDLRSCGRWSLPDHDFARMLIVDIDSATTLPARGSNPDIELLCRMVWAMALTVEALDHLARSLPSDAHTGRRHLVLTAYQVAEHIEEVSKRALDGTSIYDQRRIWIASIDALRNVYAREVPDLREEMWATPSDEELILLLADCARKPIAVPA